MPVKSWTHHYPKARSLDKAHASDADWWTNTIEHAEELKNFILLPVIL